MTKQKQCVFLLFLPIWAFFISYAAPPSYAQNDILKYSETEKVGFAFYQFIGTEPDFSTWVKNSSRYRDSSPVEKDILLRQDVTRLRNGYYYYIPDQDLIKVELPGTLTTSNYLKRAQQDGVATQIQILFKDIPDNIIPFRIGEMWIALVPQDIDAYTNRMLNSYEYPAFAHRSGFNSRSHEKELPVTVTLNLRPIAADGEEPVIIDNMPIWLMLAEIGSFEVKPPQSRDGRYIFEDFADWYTARSQRQLLELYDR